MKKEKAVDYSIDELVAIANALHKIAGDDCEFRATDVIIYEIANRTCVNLDLVHKEMPLVEAIAAAERIIGDKQ